MFGMKVNEQMTLKILEAHDTEALFNLVNRSRDSLREWLPWVDATEQPSDTRAFIKRGLCNLLMVMDFSVVFGMWER